MSADQELVRKLRVQVAERLNEQRRRDQVNGVPPMSAEDDREYARSLIVQVLEDHARYELAEGRTPPTPDDDAQIAGAIHSALFGVGRLQPLIDDPEVENIDINGCDQVFVQYGDGREETPGPVAESDEELVELIQVLAAHAGLTSRPFDSANPQLDLRLPTHRLAQIATVVVEIRLLEDVGADAVPADHRLRVSDVENLHY